MVYPKGRLDEMASDKGVLIIAPRPNGEHRSSAAVSFIIGAFYCHARDHIGQPLLQCATLRNINLFIQITSFGFFNVGTGPCTCPFLSHDLMSDSVVNQSGETPQVGRHGGLPLHKQFFEF